MQTHNFSTWGRLHSVGALLAVALCTALGRIEPLLVWGVASIGVFVWRYRVPQPRAAGFGWANAITLARLGCVTIPALASGGDAFWTGLGVTVALVLDAVDGLVARRLGESSPFGAQFDMEVDAHATAVISTVLFVSGRFEAWVLVPGLLRYIWVIARAIGAGNALPDRRTWTGRLAAVAMMSGLLLSAVGPPEERWPLAALATVIVVLSFAQDFAQLGRFLVRRHEPA